MARTIEITGASIVYFFYAVSLAIVPIFAYSVVLPVDDLTSLLVAGLLVALVLVVAADLWYWHSGELSEHLTAAATRNLPYDITYDPFSDPGTAAKDRWLRATSRLPDGEDDEE